MTTPGYRLGLPVITCVHYTVSNRYQVVSTGPTVKLTYLYIVCQKLDNVEVGSYAPDDDD